MKKTVLVAMAGLLIQPALANAGVDPRALELKSMEIREIKESGLRTNLNLTNFADCNSKDAGNGVNQLELPASLDGLEDPLTMLEVVVDRIINIGKKIWAVVDAGRPVVNVKTDVAHALPAGLHCWSDLAGWSIPNSKVYEVTYKNGFDMEVVKFAYRVLYTSGGSYNGTGKYIANATIVPAKMYVAWGFNFDVQAQVPLVFNSGSVQSPVGGMQLDIRWKVHNALNISEQAESFYIGGNGEFKKLD